jgi:hypothetical protein
LLANIFSKFCIGKWITPIAFILLK